MNIRRSKARLESSSRRNYCSRFKLGVVKLARDQLQSRKDKAIRFVRDVLGDPNRAEEIAEESREDYAARRKIQVANPTRRVTSHPGARGKLAAGNVTVTRGSLLQALPLQ